MVWDSLTKLYYPDLPRWKFLTIVLHTSFMMLLAGLAAPGYTAIRWMDCFDHTEYGGWEGFLRFVRDLKTGVPPVQSICELAVFNLTGSFFFFTQILYRCALVFVYMTALYWRPRSNASFVLSLVTGTVFLWSTVLLHRFMPLSYDIFFPALGFLFLLFQPVSSQDGTLPHWMCTRCFLSGVMLSLLELTRPFILLILPLLLLGSLSAIRPSGKKCILLHLLPLLLLSGGWHLKLYLLHEGQIIWSNHSGFNLVRAWKDIGIDIPPLLDESGQPVPQSDPGLLNSIGHSRHNEIVKAQVMEALLRAPAVTLKHAFRRLALFLKPNLTMYRATPIQHPVLWLYRPLVWLSAGWLFWRFFFLLGTLVWVLVVSRRQSHLLFKFLGNCENQLIVLAVLSIVILAMGEAGEEVRLLISVLPWMAVYPIGKGIPSNRVDPIEKTPKEPVDRLRCVDML